MSQKSNLDLKWFFKRFFSQLNWHPAIIIIFVDSTVGIDHSHFAFKRSVIQALIFTTGPWSEKDASLARGLADRPVVVAADAARVASGGPGGNCIKIGLPGKLILGDYFQENRTSRRPFLLLRIRFPGRPIFIQLPPGSSSTTAGTPWRGATTSTTPSRWSRDSVLRCDLLLPLLTKCCQLWHVATCD